MNFKTSLVPDPVESSTCLDSYLFESLAVQHSARRIAMIGTYAPRRCGIATFTEDVVRCLEGHKRGTTVNVYALTKCSGTLQNDRVTKEIVSDDPQSMLRAANAINASGVEAVWLQHEFGIYGGPDGELVCDLVRALAAPLIVTFHTVLRQPSENQSRIMQFLLTRASRVMVMSQSSRDLLIKTYGARTSQVRVIEHGAPDRPFVGSDAMKKRLGIGSRPVLMTFGLLGPGKGIETAIAALPAICANHPDLLYRIVGVTHPDIVKDDGDSYRLRLMDMAQELGVADNISWDNRFVGSAELFDQLEACDIYLTPYPNLQQSTSGTLSYAVALGKAVISTPYEHARELLADGAGVLITPGDSAAIAGAVNGLLDDPAKLHSLRQAAYARGRQTIWPAFSQAADMLVDEAIAPPPIVDGALRPPAGDGLFGMCDATGMLQHSIGVVPDRRHGYCLDDNVRALISMHDSHHLSRAERERWSLVYASFVQHAWNADLCTFRNFMSFDRTWCEERGSFDSFGRALWGLGATAERAVSADLRAWGLEWFERCLPGFGDVDCPRSLALAMQGAASVLRVQPSHTGARDLLMRGGNLLMLLLQRERRPGWRWFEVVLAYDNPRLSLALLLAGQSLGRPDWIEAGLDALEWIGSQQTSAAGMFRPIGSETFGLPGISLPFDQQPLEAQATIEAADVAFGLTGDAVWISQAKQAWLWFFGANDRGVVLADLQSGRCRDGITPRGFNLNCGAESILALHASYNAMARLTARTKLRVAGGQRTEAGQYCDN